jgi:hypothetical protein
MSREESMSRLQGRKTLAPLPGIRPRERPPRAEDPTANDDATLPLRFGYNGRVTIGGNAD